MDAVSEAELMTDLVAHDMACAHEKVLISVFILDAIPSWIIASKRNTSDSFCKTSPSEAEAPGRIRIQVLHSAKQSCISVGRPIFWHIAKDASLATGSILFTLIANSALDLCVKEVCWDSLSALTRDFLTSF